MYAAAQGEEDGKEGQMDRRGTVCMYCKGRSLAGGGREGQQEMAGSTQSQTRRHRRTVESRGVRSLLYVQKKKKKKKKGLLP
mmetsp:Transcript_20669/g.66522  ORF Transcript_20669/g.66522 Transcript_20669/m.66522 type:complete len:82 (+) Transcript_20669:69-314(+)